MLRMVSYPHRPKSGHITCYLNRTYHVLPTEDSIRIDKRLKQRQNGEASWGLAYARSKRSKNLSRSIAATDFCLCACRWHGRSKPTRLGAAFGGRGHLHGGPPGNQPRRNYSS